MYGNRFNLPNYAFFEVQNIQLIKYLHLHNADFDLLQVHGETVPFFPHTTLPIFHPWMIVKKPVCLTLHALWSLFNKESYIKKSEKIIFNRVDHIIVVERFLKQYLIENFGIEKSKISFLPSSLPINKVAVCPEPLAQDYCKKKISNKKIIFAPQRFSPERNVFSTLKSASILMQSKKDVVFLMAGAGPLLEKAKKYAVNLGIEDNVVFLGFINNASVLSIMKESYVIINSTIAPGAGKITLESFALKKPVLRARTMDTYPVIDNNTGLVYDSSNPADLAEKLSIILEDDVLATQFGAKGNKIFLEEYDFDRIVGGYEKIYSNLAKN